MKVPQIEPGMFNKSFSFECYIHITCGFQDKLQGSVFLKEVLTIGRAWPWLMAKLDIPRLKRVSRLCGPKEVGYLI